MVDLAPDTALPPSGRYAGLVDGRPTTVEVDPAGRLRVHDDAGAPDRPVTVTFLDHRTTSPSLLPVEAARGG